MMTQNRRTIAKKWTVHIHLPLIPFKPDSKLIVCEHAETWQSVSTHVLPPAGNITNCLLIKCVVEQNLDELYLQYIWTLQLHYLFYNLSDNLEDFLNRQPTSQSINQSNQSLWLFYLFFTRSLQQEEISQTNSNIYRWRNDSINIKQAVKSSLHHILCIAQGKSNRSEDV